MFDIEIEQLAFYDESANKHWVDKDYKDILHFK